MTRCAIPGTAIKDEILSRAPLYADDWIVPLKSKANLKRTLSATVFMFFTSLAPAITFASFLVNATKSQYGVIEVLASSALCGMIFSTFAGQGLVIVGVTGPVSIFSDTVFRICESLFKSPELSGKEAFLPFMFWVAFWAAVMHIILALFGSCSAVKYVTRFSCEVFGAYIGVIYIVTAVVNLNEVFQNGTTSQALLCLIWALLTFLIASSLNGARRWSIFNKGIRALISDYSVAFSAILFTALNGIRKFSEVGIDTLPVPQSFEPSNGRDSWIIDPSIIPTDKVFLAILPGFVLTVLFFFDHNVSSLLAQQPHHNLKKPATFNLDFLVVGFMIFLCGLLGIPFTNGLIPQAPLHVRALSKIKEIAVEDPHHPGRFVKQENFVYVVEQRVSNFTHSLLIGIMSIFPVFLDILRAIPVSVLDGLFLFMGISSFTGNHFFERFLVSFLVYDSRSRLHAAPHSWPDIEMSKISFSKVVKFTIFQVVFLGVIVGVTYSPIAIAFPMIILIMVPTRLWILTWKKLGSWRFTEEELDILDNQSLPIDADEDDGMPIPEFELAEYDKNEELEKERSTPEDSAEINLQSNI